MDDPLALLQAGTMITLHLSDGNHRHGVVRACGGGWLQLLGTAGDQLINLSQVVAVDLNAAPPVMPSPIDDPRPRPVSKDIPFKVGSRAPGRPWQDDDLKGLADGFLEGRTDPELSERFHRTRSQVKELRQGFECARGTVTEDEVSQVARTWVRRWRRVLSGQP
jgi:hypothetical protein